MDMKVYDRNLTGAAAAGSTRTQDRQNAESSSSGGAQSSGLSGGGDQVELSGTLGRLSQALSAQGTQSASAVAELAAAYRSGNYQPNATGVSRGLVSEALSATAGQ
jgi:anti-sigma28 factor (negative regulator of flagellin synthesis)